MLAGKISRQAQNRSATIDLRKGGENPALSHQLYNSRSSSLKPNSFHRPGIEDRCTGRTAVPVLRQPVR